MIDFSLPYKKKDFLNFLESFLPEDYKEHNEELEIPFKSKYTNKVTFWGESNSLNLAVYKVKHSSENDARVSLTREMFRLMAAFGKRRALVVLIPKTGDSYRFSLVTIDLKIDEKNKIQRDYSNPKRYSFILGVRAVHTPQKFLVTQGRVTSFEDLQKRFSVEVVNKEFYNQIAVMFSRLVGGKRKQGSRTKNYDHELELPSTPYEHNEQKYKEFAVRLIGRTVFCWFLKKKKSADGIPLIPEDVLSTFAISFNPNYYHGRVEPLFFNVLNTPVNERSKEFKEKPYNQIPFLNGGLFEPQPDDFYPNNKPNYALKIPDQWWRDFIDILETYNFTIDENTSIDIDLSVDPEMLGRIFENLLAEINPETGESARKSTGSYYTPRPIVEYMVDESLKQYLVTQTSIDEEKLDLLLDYSREESGLDANEEDTVNEALSKIKVLDPACGSGAFPMGILQKMLLILQKVDHNAENSIEQILADIKDPVYRKLIESKLKAAQVYDDDDLDDYARKLNIIRRSIYGVDIQPVAVDIAKLRFFLSIIVDEVIQDDLPNRGIEPLPNLEFKFVCANTLIPLPPDRQLFENVDSINKLEELRDQYFISYGEEKQNIKNEFRKVQAQMFNTSIDLLSREPGSHNTVPQTQTQMLATWNPFSNDSTKWFDPKWMFGERDGFDIAIGNPPYIGEKKFTNLFAPIKNHIFWKPFYRRRSNLYYFFIIYGIFLNAKNGVLSYIVPNEFMTADWANRVRKYILKNTNLSQLLLFENSDVFEDAGTSSAVLLLIKNQKRKNGKLFLIDEFSKELNLKTCLDKEAIINQDNFDESGTNIWHFFESENKRIEEIELGEICEVSQGIVTGCDRVTSRHAEQGLIEKSLIGRGIFVLREDIDYKYHNDRIYLKIEEAWVKLKRKDENYLKPFINSTHLKRYKVKKTDELIIYVGNQEPSDNIYDYLFQFKTVLINRSTTVDYNITTNTFDKYTERDIKKVYSSAGAVQKVMKRKHWYKPLYERLSVPFDNAKIVVNTKKMDLFSYSGKPVYASGGGLGGQNYIYLKPKQKSNYLLEVLKLTTSKEFTKLISIILNSKLTKKHIKEGNFNQLSTSKIKQLKIIKLPLDCAEVFSNYIAIVKCLKSPPAILDLMVYKLYELSYEEALIVDPELPGIISREDYEQAGIEELAEWEV
ncbi:N-6 DNA methylase [uncultured Draconibacterium sp.]|uniref:Eco57I restriction-modification methylase domain-containing protein n=1 Tax=uncultured Draconibacterium sp. TaxID=1573823 RepID=UPI0025D8E6E7|nr:N-6 DNA methylase [uncultured Draconibacterium sp.]